MNIIFLSWKDEYMVCQGFQRGGNHAHWIFTLHPPDQRSAPEQGGRYLHHKFTMIHSINSHKIEGKPRKIRQNDLVDTNSPRKRMNPATSFASSEDHQLMEPRDKQQFIAEAIGCPETIRAWILQVAIFPGLYIYSASPIQYNCMDPAA